MPECADDLTEMYTAGLNYGWATAEQVNCAVDDGMVKTLGGLILEVPANAKGTYVIALDPDPNYSGMWKASDELIPGVVFTPACITVPARMPTTGTRHGLLTNQAMS